MAAYRGIAFLTDYGLEDAFVAACHGVILGIAPAARIVDITHLVPPQDVRRGAAVLAAAAPYLAPMVFVAVVDPGVGGDRRPVAVEAGGSVLVGPDNGLLLPAAEQLGGPGRAVTLDRTDLFVHPVSATFHGRDIFCPVAARLFGGLPLTQAGTAIDAASLHRLPDPVSRRGDGWFEAEVVQVDRFGNVALAAAEADLQALGVRAGDLVEVGAAQQCRAVVGRQFASVPPGEVVLHLDSDGRVSVAVNQGRADTRIGVGAGEVVGVRACAPPE